MPSCRPNTVCVFLCCYVCTYLIVCDQSDDCSISHFLQDEYLRLNQVCKLLMS